MMRVQGECDENVRLWIEFDKVGLHSFEEPVEFLTQTAEDSGFGDVNGID